MVDTPIANQEEPPPQEETTPRKPATKKPKRFQCTRCETRFARLEHLQRHERIHTQEKPFGCQLCDHRFTRSDLLIRHERLSHNRDGSRKRELRTSRTSKSTARKLNASAASSYPASPMPLPPLTIDDEHRGASLAGNPHSHVPMDSSIHSSNYPLATLTMAAEHVALQIPDQAAHTHAHTAAQSVSGSLTYSQSVPASRLPEEPPALFDGHVANIDFEHSLDELAAFLDSGALSSYHFSSVVSAEQPMPFSSPESTCHPCEFGGDSHRPSISQHGSRQSNPSEVDEGGSFSRFGSRLPSLQPEEQKYRTGHRTPTRKPLSEISLADRRDILSRLTEYSSVIPTEFQLPSRLALSRYIAGYINGFHEHLPFLHVPTMSVSNCSVELILAMAAVGTQYCFEDEKTVELFYASKKIAMERIGRRDAKLAELHRRAESGYASSADGTDDVSSSYTSHQPQTISGLLGIPPQSQSSLMTPDRQDLIQAAQALLILMALATWAKHKEILREALALQSLLSTLVRDDGLRSYPVPDDISWDARIQMETTKRTKFIVYCFFNLHCIVYNIPSLILNSELNLHLPCSAAEFKAPTRQKWLEAREKVGPQPNFQEALNRLFSHGGDDITEYNSSLGNYVLIHAMIQHIFFLRQFYRRRSNSGSGMALEEITATEQALRNWQIGWKRNPESSLDPQDPNGPVAFNSTALLRLAYIRLNIDTGPGRALDTRDPLQIARAFRASPGIKRTPKLVRAVLHSAHALSIPVKIGIRLVAQTQTFIWSIQHSLCSLECAFLLSKWLEALSLPSPDPPVTEDEKRIGALVKMMLDETEFAIASDLPLESPVMIKQMNAGVLRVWAKIFKGAQTWAIVDVIGSSLNIYADMLEAD
ncbi:hypothetical protein AJ79_07628 [Helicocarpus griseus UAMH5409]|uniref:C2H2-type domain-containing protein n=1 Tax=Helicocarpus griseus UAMH5409 TaxID=1447875 RepID=A0A2B7X0N8_9EURO|nr:hypothetical protein AJ79_07628 [Helicocarpus griseus UAMH5409]